MRAVAEPDRRRRPRYLLAGDDVLEIAESQAAELFGHGDAVQPQLAHGRPQLVAREPVVGVDPGGERRDPLACEPLGRLADHVRRLAEREVQSLHGVRFTPSRPPRKRSGHADQLAAIAPRAISRSSPPA